MQSRSGVSSPNFPPEQLKIFLYEDYCADPKGVLHQIFEFAGVDASFEPALHQDANPGGDPRSRLLQAIIMRPNLLGSIAAFFLPLAVRRRIRDRISSLNVARAEFSPTARARLAAKLRPDILELQEMLGRDLSGWLESDLDRSSPTSRTERRARGACPECLASLSRPCKARIIALKIAMLTTFYPPYAFGGDGTGIQRLSTALVDRGHEVTVIHDQDAYLALAGREPAPTPGDPRIEVIGLKSPLGKLSLLLTHQLGRPVAHARQLSELLDSGRFDIIWFHNVSLIGGPGLLRYGKGLKLYEAHEHWLVCETHVLWQDQERVCEKPPLPVLHAQAQATAAAVAPDRIARARDPPRRCFHRQERVQPGQALRSFGFPREMEVIPYFLPDLPPQAETAPPHPRPYFLFVGRLEKIKGVQDIIPAFAGEDGPDLLIAGNGEYEQTLRDQAQGHPRVKFLGRLAPEALPAFYQHARALIVPSLCYETFGIIIIEAFRMGTPVLARRLGPFPEIIAKGGGLLFDGTDELEAAIDAIQSDRNYRETLSRQARQGISGKLDRRNCPKSVLRSDRQGCKGSRHE